MSDGWDAALYGLLEMLTVTFAVFGAGVLAFSLIVLALCRAFNRVLPLSLDEPDMTEEDPVDLDLEE